MRILILGLNYKPESTSIGPYTADLAEFLARCGHDVRVITGFPAAPGWAIWPEYTGSFYRSEVVDGIRVLRCPMYMPRDPRRTAERILFDSSFSMSAFIGGLTTGAVDLVVAVSPPLQLGLAGLALARRCGAAFFLYLQDLVPDAAVSTGVLAQGSVALRLARKLEGFVYSKADAVGVISDGFKHNLVAKGVPEKKISILYNSIDTDWINPNYDGTLIRERFEVGRDEFFVLYSGSIGGKQGLESVIDAAGLLSPEEGIRIVLVGDGAYARDLRRHIEARKLRTIRMMPLQPREQLPQQLCAADVLLITQRRSVRDVVFPGKLLYYLAAGRPVLAAVPADSETGRFVSEHGVGCICEPEDPQALAHAIRSMRSGFTGEYRKRARLVAEQLFDRRQCLPRFAELLATVASGARPGCRSTQHGVMSANSGSGGAHFHSARRLPKLGAGKGLKPD